MLFKIIEIMMKYVLHIHHKIYFSLVKVITVIL